MNAMVQALKDAGIKTPPQTQRIWQWLKDNDRSGQGKPASDISLALGVPMSNVSTLLSDMVNRKMISYVDHVSLRHKSRKLRYYKAVGHTYELLPRPKAVRTEAVKADLNRLLRDKLDAMPIAGKVEHHEAAPMQREQMNNQVLMLRRPVNIDNMTIGEARELYTKLKGMFE